MSVRAALVTVGDELLLGETVDTNAAWLGRSLAGMGIDVVQRHTVGDVDGDIREAVEAAMAAAELVLVCGGLGPTPDDLTRESVAGVLGRELVEDEAVLDALRRRYEGRGYGSLPENSRSQAQVPRGATALENPHGTAPGLAMEEGDGVVVLLPGVPRELQGIFETGVRPLLRRRFGEELPRVHLRVICTTGIPESLLAERVAEVLPQGPAKVSMAFLPDVVGVELRLTARGMAADEAEAAFDEVEEVLSDILDPHRFDDPDGDLAGAVLNTLRSTEARLATAESCTGGHIGKRLTDGAGASDVYVGGVVAYANEVKEELLGVRPETLRDHGAVSEEVAVEMARGVARLTGASAAVAVTGIAGPDGGTEEKPVGMVWHAAFYQGRTVTEVATFPGDRQAVRERAAQAALFLLLRLLDGRL